MDLIIQFLQELIPTFLVATGAVTIVSGGFTINSINKSLIIREKNKHKYLKLYKRTGEVKETQESEIYQIIKLIFKGNNKQDYLNFINMVKGPEELKDIIETFTTNVDEKNLRFCARNLQTVKINKKNIMKDLKDYLSNLKEPIVPAGLYYRTSNTIDLFIPSKRVLSHEFIHMCSSNGEDCGFSVRDFGRGLNEGYTELLNKRIFKYKTYSYHKNVNITKLLETFFDDPKDFEKAFFNNDLDAVLIQFCKYGTKEEFFDLLEKLDNFAMGKIPINDFIEYQKLKFKLYDIIKRSNDENKIKNFENILFQSSLSKILHNGYTLTSPYITSKRLK